MAGAKIGRDLVEIGHAAHVDPGLRHGDDHVGMAEAERGQHLHRLVRIRDLLAHQVLAGDAEMRRAAGQLADDLGGREEGDLDVGHAGERAAIIAGAAGLGEDEAGAGEERGGVLLQAPLGGNGQDERRIGHQGLPTMRSSQKEQPTAGIGASAPRCSSSRS